MSRPSEAKRRRQLRKDHAKAEAAARAAAEEAQRRADRRIGDFGVIPVPPSDRIEGALTFGGFAVEGHHRLESQSFELTVQVPHRLYATGHAHMRTLIDVCGVRSVPHDAVRLGPKGEVLLTTGKHRIIMENRTRGTHSIRLYLLPWSD